jgi:hypothetical protein
MKQGTRVVRVEGSELARVKHGVSQSGSFQRAAHRRKRATARKILSQ